MSAFPQLAWLEALRNRVNADSEMKLIGRWFSTSISLIPNPIDQNPWAHWRSPMDMMRQG
jgi:hypothetical protein